MPKKPKIITETINDPSGIPTKIELTAEEYSLVNAYFQENMNQVRAYLRVHPGTKYDSAKTEASTFFTSPYIRAVIAQRLRDKAMSADEVLYRLGDMARATQRPFIKISDDGFVYFDFSQPEAAENIHLIKKMETKRERRLENGRPESEWEGEWVKVELHDAQAALALLGKYHKLLTDKDDAKEDAEPAQLVIPVDMIAGPYLNAYRDIISRKYTEYPFGDGRGSGKSSFVYGLMVPYLIVNNPTIHALLLRQKAKDLRDSVYAQVEWGVNELGLTKSFRFGLSPLKITYLPTGQHIYFSGADDPGSIKSIKPPFGHIGILGFEEFDQFRGEEAIRNILQSALRGGNEAWMFETWNTPKSIQNWVNKWILVPKEKRRPIVQASYLDLPPEWLGQTFIDEAEHLKATNPKAYEHEYMGVATGTGGQVFENLEIREITDAEIAQFERPSDGIDWGFYPNPFVWGRSHYDAARTTIYIYDECVLFKKSNQDTYDHLAERGKIDPNIWIIADSAEPKSIADFLSYGARIRGSEKGPDSVKYSYKWLQSRAKIVIDPKRCPNHAREFIECEYEQMKDGTFIGDYPDHNNHCIDRTRYAHNLEWRQRGK